jgi:hypothetical protein
MEVDASVAHVSRGLSPPPLSLAPDAGACRVDSSGLRPPPLSLPLLSLSPLLAARLHSVLADARLALGLFPLLLSSLFSPSRALPSAARSHSQCQLTRALPLLAGTLVPADARTLLAGTPVLVDARFGLPWEVDYSLPSLSSLSHRCSLAPSGCTLMRAPSSLPSFRELVPLPMRLDNPPKSGLYSSPPRSTLIRLLLGVRFQGVAPTGAALAVPYYCLVLCNSKTLSLCYDYMWAQS